MNKRNPKFSGGYKEQSELLYIREFFNWPKR